MLESFYLFFIPFFAVCAYVTGKFFLHREELANMENNAFINHSEIENNFEIAKENIFVFFDNIRGSSLRSVILFFHWVLHFFVLFLKFISDLTDVLYARSRDFFLQTAAKEKDAVSTFWHHLKEYKKEKEEEIEEKNK